MMTEDRLISSCQIKIEQQKYRYFSKSFRAELQFIEAVINYDQIIKHAQEECFPCFRSDPNKDLIEELAQKYNPQFCLAFKTMRPQQRENYQDELKHLIHLLEEEIKHQCKRQARQHQARQTQDNQMYHKQWMRHRVQKRLRNNLVKSLLPQNFKTAIMKKMMLESFELKVMIEGSSSEKMVKFDHFFMHLVSKTKKNESKIILGMRNYLLMSSDRRGYTHRMQSIYPTIQPQSIHLQFNNHQQKNMILNYLQWIIKIGKVESLIRNYEIEKKLQVVVEQVDSRYKNGVYSTVFQRSFSFDETDEDDSDQDDDISKMALYRSQNFIYDQAKNRQMRQKIYNDMKTKLIATLKQIAEKKKKQNDRINQFHNRHRRIGPKFKSDAILNSLKDPENVLYDSNLTKIIKIFDIHTKQLKKNSTQAEKVLQKMIQVPKLVNEDNHLKASSQELINEIENYVDQSSSEAQAEDSFLSKNNYERQHYKNKYVQTILNTFIKKQPDIYSTVFYKDRKIKSDDNLTGYTRIMISKDIYVVPEPKPQPTQQSIKLKEKAQRVKLLQSGNTSIVSHKKGKHLRKSSDRYHKTKGQSKEKPQSITKMQKTFHLQKVYEIINKQCSLLQKNNKLNSLKVFIKQRIHLRYLLSVVADVTSWHQWHPNIISVKLISQDKEKNICEFEFKCKVANHQFQYKVMAHFFNVEDIYYLVMKTQPKEENQNSSSFWKTFNFWKKSQNVKMDYLLIKMHKSTTDGVSKLVFDFQLDQDTYSKKPKILTQQVTLFLNFYFAHEYCKTIKNKIDSLPQIQKRQTQLKIEKGKRLFNDSLFRIDWTVDNSVVQSKQHHWNKLNGQSL